LKYRILNNNSLEFFDATANNTGLIAANGVNLKISANNGVIELGDTASDVQVGTVGTAINWTFLGGGTVGAGGTGVIAMGSSGDTVNMNVSGVTYQYPSNLVRYTDITATNNKINITTQVPGTINLSLPNRPVTGQLSLTDNVPSTSNSTGTLTVGGGVGVSGNIYVGGTNAGANGIYTDVLRYAANGLPWVMGSGGGAAGGNVSASGWTANTLLFANATGFLTTNANISYYDANSTISVGGLNLSAELQANNGIIIKNDSIDFVGGLQPKIAWRKYNTSGLFPQDPNTMTANIRSFSVGSLAATGTFPAVNLSTMTFGGLGNYICEVAGYIYANTGGVYSFGVNSDDNSDLFIDGKLVADWYALTGHGANASGTPGGNQRTIYLNQGYHRLYGRWQQGGGGDSYEILWKNPGDSSFSVVPASVLYHHPTDFIISANDNVLFTQTVQISNTANSISNTTGALVVSGGVGVTGNVYLSAANNFITSTSQSSYRLGWTDNYFQRSAIFGGMMYQGNYLTLDAPVYLESNRPFTIRGAIYGNDVSNNVVVFAGVSPILVQNTAAAVSNSTGSLIVNGGIGITGNLFMSTANNFFNTTTGASYRLGWTDNYFYKDERFGGLNFSGGYLNMATTLITSAALSIRSTVQNDAGNNVIVFAGNSPVLHQNGAAAVSNSTGALIVQGGIGTSGAIYSTGGSITINNGLATTGNSGTIFLGDGSFTKTYGGSWTFGGGVRSTGAGFTADGVPGISYTGYVFSGTGQAIYQPSTGVVGVLANSANAFMVSTPVSSVNYLQVSGNTAGGSAIISAQGTDTNVGINVLTKGTSGYLDIGSPSYLNTLSVRPGTGGVGLYASGSGNSELAIGSLNYNLRFFTSQGTNEQLRLTNTSGSVNFIQMSGNTTGNNPTITGGGSDAAVALTMQTKNANTFVVIQDDTSLGTAVPGTGLWVTGQRTGLGRISLKTLGAMYLSPYGGNALYVTTGSSTAVGNDGINQLWISHVSSAVNYLQMYGAVTNSGPTIAAVGSDTNVQLNLQSKGSGNISFTKGNDATNTSNYLFNNSGGLISYSAGAYWRGLHIAAPSLVVSGGNQYPRHSSYFEYDTLTDPTVRNFYHAIGNVAVTNTYNYIISNQTGGNIDFKGSAGNSPTDITFRIVPANSIGGLIHTNYIQVSGNTTGNAPVLSAQGTDGNIGLVLQPKGTGALQAQPTDSTAAGGNARGANAVDWQTSRSTAARVASGQYSVIGGGVGNQASVYGTTVSGGDTNSATGYVSATVGGAGNYTNSGYSFAGAGLSNGATGGAAGVVGGYFNVASGYNSFIGGGERNQTAINTAVTTQAANTFSNTTVTLNTSNASIKLGQLVQGTGITTYPNQTYVAAIGGTNLTLSQNASSTTATTLSFYTPHGIVVGGGYNMANGSFSFIGGGGDAGIPTNGNRAPGDWSAIAGGLKNTASGNWSFVGGGQTNNASGLHAVIVGGGTYAGSTASGTAAFIGGGWGNFSNNQGSSVVGGNNNQATGTNSFVAGGSYGTARSIAGYHVFPASVNPISSTTGITQAALLILARQTTDATSTVLTSDTAVATTTNQIILPDNSAYFFKGSLIAGVTGAGATAAWEFKGAIKRGSGVASTVLMNSVTDLIAQDSAASSWTFTLTADTTNGGLTVTVTGQASTTIRWVCKIETTEMTY